MGWQARLSKENKPKFDRTCNKCSGTDVKRTYIFKDGVALETPLKIKCRCVLRQEAEDKCRAEQDLLDQKLVAGMLKEEPPGAILIAK